MESDINKNISVLRATVMHVGYNRELTEDASGLFSPGGGAVYSHLTQGGFSVDLTLQPLARLEKRR